MRWKGGGCVLVVSLGLWVSFGEADKTRRAAVSWGEGGLSRQRELVWWIICCTKSCSGRGGLPRLFQSETKKAETGRHAGLVAKWKMEQLEGMDSRGTHPAIVDTRLAEMTLDIAKLIALVVVWRLRDRLWHELLLLLLLLDLLLAGFDRDAVRCCDCGDSSGDGLVTAVAGAITMTISMIWLQQRGKRNAGRRGRVLGENEIINVHRLRITMTHVFRRLVAKLLRNAARGVLLQCRARRAIHLPILIAAPASANPSSMEIQTLFVRPNPSLPQRPLHCHLYHV